MALASVRKLELCLFRIIVGSEAQRFVQLAGHTHCRINAYAPSLSINALRRQTPNRQIPVILP